MRRLVWLVCLSPLTPHIIKQSSTSFLSRPSSVPLYVHAYMRPSECALHVPCDIESTSSGYFLCIRFPRLGFKRALWSELFWLISSHRGWDILLADQKSSCCTLHPSDNKNVARSTKSERILSISGSEQPYVVFPATLAGVRWWLSARATQKKSNTTCHRERAEPFVANTPRQAQTRPYGFCSLPFHSPCIKSRPRRRWSPFNAFIRASWGKHWVIPMDRDHSRRAAENREESVDFPFV